MRWGTEARLWLHDLAVDAAAGEPATLARRAAELNQLPPGDLLLLDRLSRWFSYASWVSRVDTPDWNLATLSEPTAVTATVASWQRDGFLRERATEVLAGLDGSLAMRALALRALDPVEVVRERARHVIVGRAKASDVVDVIDIVIQAGTLGRGAEAREWLLDWVDHRHDASTVVDQALASQRRTARRWALAWGIQRQVLSMQRLCVIAQGDPDQWLPPVAAAAVLGQRVDMAEMLSHSSNAAVRSMALSSASDADVDAAWFQARLADRSARVRNRARERCRRAGIDLSSRDAFALMEGSRVPELVAAIGEVSALSPAASLDVLARHRSADSPRVRAAAATAIGRAWRRDAAVPQLVDMLGDGSPRVARAAASALATLRAPASIAEGLWCTGGPGTRRAVWLFWSRLGGWPALRAHLLAISGEDPDLREVGTLNLAAWCRDVGSRMWTPPANELAADIHALLFALSLPERQRELLAFVSGMGAEAGQSS